MPRPVRIRRVGRRPEPAPEQVYPGPLSRRARHRMLDGGSLLTRPQLDFLTSQERILVWWGANQIGKSYGVALDILLFMLGRHPDQTHRTPVKIAAATEALDQFSETVIEKVWRLSDPRWWPSRLRWESGHLKGLKQLTIQMVDGPGKGSELVVRSFKQGPKRIAGGTYHRFLLDEPPPEKVYGEVVPRLRRHGGHMRITFTPTLATSEDVLWVWDRVDKGEIAEHRTELELDAVKPWLDITGRPALALPTPWLSSSQIESFAADCLDAEREMRLGRSRVPMVRDRVLTGWGEHLIDGDAPTPGLRVAVGIDHGSGAGRQRAIIIAGVRRAGDWHIWILSEYASDGRSTPEQDARGIISALERVGLSLGDVDVWIGDRAHAGDKYGGKKSNALLLSGFRDAIKGTGDKLPQALISMRTPYKVEGSMWAGMTRLNAMALQRRLHIAPGNGKIISDGLQWRGKYDDPCKDGLDALRYAVEALAGQDWWR